jgi:serine/threonine-protein kinase
VLAAPEAPAALASRPLASTIFDAPEGAEGAPSSDTNPSFVPRTFADRYALVSQLGEGGMGEVWLLQDRQLDRGVALKTVRSDKRGQSSDDLFADEVLLQARLDHPAFVPVHEVGVGPAGEPYFTMRRVEGQSLAEALASSGADDVRGRHRLLRAFAQVCAAVHFAHDRGIVHRDLKPANVMLGAYGEVYVLDLGIAQRVQTEAPAEPGQPGQPAAGAARVGPRDTPISTTRTVVRAGTPGYMAPEQATAPETVNASADVYALGCILFELLVQRPLHNPDTLQSRKLLECYQAANPSPLDAMRSREGALPVTPELDQACRQALALDPAKRGLTARDLHDQVVAYLDGAAINRWRQDEATKLSQQAAELVALGHAREGSDTFERRQRALTALGRAVSLAPADEATRDVIRGLLQEPPPADAQQLLSARMESWQRVWATEAASGLVLALCTWVVCVPLMWWMGIRDAPYATGLLGLGAATIAWVLAFLWRKPPRAWALLGLGALSTTAVALSGRWLGPFGVAPAVFVAHMSFFAMVPERRTRLAMMGLLVCGGLFPLGELLLTGQVANMRIADGSIVITPLVTHLPPVATWASLLFINVAVMLSAAVSMRVVLERMEDTQRTILWHQWQIEALMDVQAGPDGDADPLLTPRDV